MIKQSKNKREELMPVKKLNKAIWLMRISTIFLIMLIAQMVIVFDFTAFSWILLCFAIIFLVLGLCVGISYLMSAHTTKEVGVDANG